MIDSNRLRAAPEFTASFRVVVSVCVVGGLGASRVVQAQNSPWLPWCCVLMLRGLLARVKVSAQSRPGRREERHARVERVESCRASEGGRVRWLGQPSVASQGSWAWAKDEGDPLAVSGRSFWPHR